jgi:hypothetical protein
MEKMDGQVAHICALCAASSLRYDHISCVEMSRLISRYRILPVHGHVRRKVSHSMRQAVDKFMHGSCHGVSLSLYDAIVLIRCLHYTYSFTSHSPIHIAIFYTRV